MELDGLRDIYESAAGLPARQSTQRRVGSQSLRPEVVRPSTRQPLPPSVAVPLSLSLSLSLCLSLARELPTRYTTDPFRRRRLRRRRSRCRRGVGNPRIYHALPTLSQLLSLLFLPLSLSFSLILLASTMNEIPKLKPYIKLLKVTQI